MKFFKNLLKKLWSQKLKRRHLRYIKSRVGKIGKSVEDGPTQDREFESMFAHLKTSGLPLVYADSIEQLGNVGPSAALRWMIFLGKGFGKMPTHEKIRILRHESAHIMQQKRMGFPKFVRRYFGSERWRFAIECSAELEVCLAMKHMGMTRVDICEHARDWVEQAVESKIYRLNRLNKQIVKEQVTQIFREMIFSKEYQEL